MHKQPLISAVCKQVYLSLASDIGDQELTVITFNTSHLTYIVSWPSVWSIRFGLAYWVLNLARETLHLQSSRWQITLFRSHKNIYLRGQRKLISGVKILPRKPLSNSNNSPLHAFQVRDLNTPAMLLQFMLPFCVAISTKCSSQPLYFFLKLSLNKSTIFSINPARLVAQL